MDEATFAGVEPAFRAFHRVFSPLFGHPRAEDRSEQYLRGLLVQQTDRRNAENLAEAVAGATPRALQRFLTDSPWDHRRVLDRLQAYLGPRLNTPSGVWVLDDTGFAKQGTRSVGVARQYSGTLGKVGNCQVGVFLGYVSERGHALVDTRLFLPEAWTDDPARCRAAGVPATVAFASKWALGLAMVRGVRVAGHLQAGWVTGDAGYGDAPGLRDGLDADGCWYVLEVACTTPIFLAPAQAAVPAWSGRGRRPTRVRLVAGEPPPTTVGGVAAELVAADWQVVTVGEGAQGPRTYQVAARRGWESRDGIPGRPTWLVLRRNLDGSELKYALSNAPADTPVATLGRVLSWRWPIETLFETGKGETGLDEYEVRSWVGWHHHITLALLAGAFLLTLQQDWGGKGAGRHAAAGQPGAPRNPAPSNLEPRRPRALADRDPAPQRAQQTGTPQTPERQVA